MGKVWATIGVLAAAGESKNLASYFFTDGSPLPGNNLYRLKMIDKDATFSYSRIRNIDFTGNKSINGYPNPVFDKLTVSGEGSSQIERIQLSDLSGKMMFDLTKQVGTEASTNVDVKNISAGIYVIKLTLKGGGVDYLRIAKQ